MNTLLFVVDVQNGFVSSKTEFVLERITSLLQKDLFDFVAFTQFVNEKPSPYREYLHWSKLSTSIEQEIYPEIQPFATNVFKKGIYSAINAETMKFIKDHNIEKVFILGMDTDCCVLKTAVDLFENHIHPIVLAHYSASNGGKVSHDAGVKVLERLIGRHNTIHSEVNVDIISAI
ncbi:isochorismatase family cysteine hydrolase [Shimazuella kribbensis]|uniref:isochorismatase family cysteine hydrolase n=1 Tax=Shimazuella kribbensis TaxID=139808 RepID=UPI000685B37B|nr:isochorismatase family cysteine hydrolase [Shimazuella kribbensis]